MGKQVGECTHHTTRARRAETEGAVQYEISTSRREEMANVTRQVAEAVQASGVQAGVVVVSSPHTTAGIIVNENADPDVARDLIYGLGKLCPADGGWRHVEGNSDAHLKAALVGTSVTIPIEAARLVLGTWQAVYFAEFDGPRRRHFNVAIIPGIA